MTKYVILQAPGDVASQKFFLYLERAPVRLYAPWVKENNLACLFEKYLQ